MFRSLIAAVWLWSGALLAQEAPPPDPAAQARQVQQLRRELDELRARVTQAETRATQAEARAADAETRAAQGEQLVSQLSQLNEQVAGLRAQLEAAQAQAAQRAAELEGAVEGVMAVQQQLVTGDTSGASARLWAAAQALPPIARAKVEAARQAIENNDLANARWYLLLAAYDAQAGR